jgi:hypothetical protein
LAEVERIMDDRPDVSIEGYAASNIDDQTDRAGGRDIDSLGKIKGRQEGPAYSAPDTENFRAESGTRPYLQTRWLWIEDATSR